MSKKELLGSGSSFSSARRPSERSERGRAKAMAQGEIPAYELVRLRLDSVSPTPLNPRRNFGSSDDLTRFGEELRQAQLAACVAVSRNAYLALWPDHASAIGTADHVLINGERRYRSAHHVGLDSLDFVVRDELARSREDFIDHLLSENLDREDFDVIERARGVAQLVAICSEEKEFGAKSRAAERLHKSPAWVTHQLSLLELPDEIQTMLSSGDLPERDGRALARALKNDPSLDSARLLNLLKTTKEQEARVKEEQQEILRTATRSIPEPAVTRAPVVLPSPTPGRDHLAPTAANPLTAVKGSPPPAPAFITPRADLGPALPSAEGPATEESVSPQTGPALLEASSPETVATNPALSDSSDSTAGELGHEEIDSSSSFFLVDRRTLPRVPWHDGSAVAALILEKMDEVQRTVLLEKLMETHGEA